MYKIWVLYLKRFLRYRQKMEKKKHRIFRTVCLRIYINKNIFLKISQEITRFIFRHVFWNTLYFWTVLSTEIFEISRLLQNLRKNTSFFLDYQKPPKQIYDELSSYFLITEIRDKLEFSCNRISLLFACRSINKKHIYIKKNNDIETLLYQIVQKTRKDKFLVLKSIIISQNSKRKVSFICNSFI